MKKFDEFSSSPEFDEDVENARGLAKFLTLHNDEIHTFEYVIESLVEVCNHDFEQAEQCTYLVHYKGQCDIKKGSYHSLVPYKKELSRRGLKATIN